MWRGSHETANNMAEVIVDRYIIETQEAQKSLKSVASELTNISAQSKKTASQVNQDFVNAARGGQMLTKQYNGLNLAVSQFARELPNAAQSAQIFFMSIGNNFGQLQDALQRINAQNKELAAQGIKGQSVFKQLASAVFSFGSALNIGVLLLVLYGKEITNLVVSLFKGTEAFNKAKESIKALNAAYDSKELTTAIKNVRELQTNIELARKGFISKEAVVLQFNQTIGKTVGEVKNLNEAEQSLMDNAREYVRMMFFKAAANAALEDSIEKALEAEKLRQSTEIGAAGVIGGALNPLNPTAAGSAQAAANQRQITQANQQSEGLLQIFKDFQNKAAVIAEKNGFNFLPEKDSKRIIESIRTISRELESVSTLTPQIPVSEAGLSGGLRPSLAVNVSELSNLELFDELDKARRNGETAYTKFLEDEIKTRQRNYDNADQDRINNEKYVQERLKEIGEQTIRNLFDLRANIEQAATDERIQRLEEEKEKELNVEGLTAEQREQIQEEFDKKRSAILNKNAEIQRRLELSQILITGALAVLRELARGGPVAAALAAVETALLYGFAQAQPLPKFAKGTERVRGGIPGKDSVQALLMPDEAVIKSSENMRHPGLARAWNEGRLESFLAMKYIEPVMNEIYRKDAALINNTFVNNNKVGLNDKRIVRNIQESNMINKLMLRELRKNKGSNFTDRRFWN